jgi:hypothetical protein
MTRTLVLAAALGLSVSGAYADCNPQHMAQTKPDTMNTASVTTTETQAMSAPKKKIVNDTTATEEKAVEEKAE